MRFENVQSLIRQWRFELSEWRSQNIRRVSLLVVALLVIYSVSLWAAASSTLDVISEFHISDVASGDSSIEETIDLALDKMDAVSESTAKTKRVAAPLLALCGIGGFIPPVRDNCDAVNGLFDRFEHAKSGAVALLNAAESVDVLVAGLRGGVDASAGTDQSDSIENLRLYVLEFDRASAAATAIPRPAGSLVLPQLVSGYDRAVGVEDDLRELAGFVTAGIAVLESGEVLELAANGAFEDLSSAGGSSAAFSDVSSALASVSPAVAQFQGDIAAFDTSMPTYLVGSGIHDQVVSISADAKMIVDLILGLSVPIEILDASLAQIKSTDASLLTGGGLTTMLAGLIEQEQELDLAGQRLLQASAGLAEGGNTRRLLGDDVAGKIDRILTQYSGLFETLSTAPSALNTLLGGDEPKRYLILGQSSDEVRPAGGFTSSVWVMTLVDGALDDIEYINVITFGENDALAKLPNPPEELVTYMDARSWYLRDVGWSPDFRSVAETALLMNEAAGHKPVDGVISLTQWAFVYMVDGLGSIDTPNGELVGSQVMTAIEEGTDTEGTNFLQSMFDSMIDSLTADRLESNFVPFTRSMLRAFDEKQIMIYATDSELEKQLVDLGWAGSFGLVNGDVLGVFDSNIGWNKVGRNIERSIEYRLELDSDGGGMVDLTITHENKSTGGVSACDAQVQPPLGGNVYHLLKDVCYWDLMRVYVPIATESVVLPELVAPARSIAVLSGHLPVGTNTADISWDEAGQYFRGLVVVPPGSVKKTVFEYELPSGTAGVHGDDLEYVLKVPIQAGIPKSNLLVRITLPPGYRIVDSSVISESGIPGVFEVDLALVSEFELRIVATKAN
jgi:hypothetical protein